MQSGNQAFINQLKDIVGGPQLLTGDRNTERYRKGFRSGEGQALAVAFPTSLLQLWRILQACVAADKIVIMQAANTGLTEGSTPAATTMTATSSSSAPCASTIFRCWTTASRWSASPAAPCTTSRNCSSPTAANRIR